MTILLDHLLPYLTLTTQDSVYYTYILQKNIINRKHTSRRNAVPLLRQFSARILVTCRASCIVFPDAITAQIMAPADEPANGVLS
jgi:hypothetical protein